MDEKKISTLAATAIALGAIIGAGIFVLSGTAIAIAGPYAILAFIIVGLVALSVALNFGMLGAIMPNAKGAAYSYVYNAFGSELGFITGILLYFSFATATSVVALGFGTTLASMLGASYAGYSDYFAVLIIFILSMVNLRGIKNAARADTTLVIIKIAILSIFVLSAIVLAFGYGHFSPANFSAANIGNFAISDMLKASIVIFFAYTGFQTVSTFTSRVKGGPKAAAKSIMSAVWISMALYLAVVIGLILLVPASSYKINADPLSFALSAAHAPEWLFILVNIGALIATASATIAMILASSRTIYQISKDGLLPEILRKYNVKFDVAINGVIITAAISIVMLFAGNVYVIAAISNFGLIFSYIMATIALMHFHRIKKTQSRPMFYPYLQIITIAALMVFIYGLPHEAFVINVIIILLLIVIYYVLREAEEKRPIKIRLFN